MSLFGHARGGFPHDLPAGVSHLSDAFEGTLGSPEEIVGGHCVLPFFLIFRNQAQRGDALAALTGDRIGSLKMRLGLPASRLGAVCPLKACPDCMEADNNLHGTAYWHREHQLPGVWLCLKHGCAMLVSAGKRAGEERFGWTLPNASDLRPFAEDGLRPDDRSAVEALARMVVEATQQPGALDASRVSEVLWHRLQDMGLASKARTLHADQVTAGFRKVIEPVRAATELGALSTSDGAIYGLVRHALCTPASGHALRHILVLRWLFGSWREFMNHFATANTKQEAPLESEAYEARDVPPKRREVLQLIAEARLSTSAAANKVGVAVATAQAWAAAAGIEVRRRPSKLAPEKLRKLVTELGSGVDLGAAAERAGVSLSSANRILRTQPGLLERRQDRLFEKQRARSRRAWETANSPAVGVALARKVEPGAYAWLYRNDRDWLLQTKATAPEQRQGPRLDWDVRDTLLAESIQTAALEVSRAPNARRITLVSLIRLVPELKAKLEALDQLPRTAKLLSALIGRRILENGRLFEDGSLPLT